MTISEQPLVVTKFSKIAASEFSASKGEAFVGIGMFSHLNSYDPTLMLNDGRSVSPSSLVPNLDRISKGDLQRFMNYLRDSVVVKTDMSRVGETKELRNTQKDHLGVLTHVSLQLKTSTNDNGFNLSKLESEKGFASPLSVPDAANVINGVGRSVVEIKDNTSAPAEATRQAIAEAFNLAIRQLDLGWPYTDIVIPIIGSNGYLIEFSCLALLPPSFPVIVKLSKVLDLTDEADTRIAAGFLYKFNEFYSTEISAATRDASVKVDIPVVVGLYSDEGYFPK